MELFLQDTVKSVRVVYLYRVVYSREKVAKNYLRDKISYGNFVKIINDEQLIYRRSWADPIQIPDNLLNLSGERQSNFRTGIK